MKREYLWYVAYGSNLCRERFIERYINRCSDTTKPITDRPYILHHRLYFAGYSRQWEGATAFLHTRRDDQAVSFGRAYLITRQQLQDIQRAEGPSAHWYGNQLLIGCMDGLPVLTLTRASAYDDENIAAPSGAYRELILQGLEEVYPGLDGSAYLARAGAPSEGFAQ